MATPRRNKALSPDGQTAKFLYCIIKQLNLKSIDWTIVAASLEITNGHAARMRYSRFKQQMESLAAQSSPSKPVKTPSKKGKQEKEGYEKPTKGKKRAVEESEAPKPKPELYKLPEQTVKPVPTLPVKQENESKRIKLEPDTCNTSTTDVPIKKEPDLPAKSTPPRTIEPVFTPTAIPPPQPNLNPNPSPLPSPSPDVWRLLPRSNPYPTLARDRLSPAPSHHQHPFGTPTDFTPPPYNTVSLSDLQLSPRSFAPANLNAMKPTSPGSLSVVPRMMPNGDGSGARNGDGDGEVDALGDLDLDMNMGMDLGLGLNVDMAGLLQGDEQMGANGMDGLAGLEGLEEGGWVITGEGKVGGG